jgi:signal transduction histidine kinase
MSSPQSKKRQRRSGLFVRIYVTFVATVLVFTVAAGLAMYSAARSYDANWVAEIADTVTEHNDSIWAVRQDEQAVHAEVEKIEQALGDGARVHIRPRHRDREQSGFAKTAGDRHHPPRLNKEQRGRLKHGRPISHHRGPLKPPVVIWRIVDPETERIAAIVVVDVPGSKRKFAFTGLFLGLLVLGGGAFVLARPLTRRLASLEHTTERFAAGDLAHRAPVGQKNRGDEIDQLGLAFNEMAAKIEALLKGQQTLLANVSHELRTPIARMRVLTEILAERVEASREPNDPTLARIDRGLDEMNEDLAEVETLINDLLTSGRLELGKDGILQLGSVDVEALLDKLARRFTASVTCEPPGLRIEADQLLLERLLSNLLSNARRACPDKTVRIGCEREGDSMVFFVEDEGPGIPLERREQIFEPFARLDAARDRDRGGAGLGLHLCRQIAQAHGGTISAESRVDGERGARMVVRLASG